MIAHQSKSGRDDEANCEDGTTGRPSASARLTNLELRVGTLKLPPMWEIEDLAVKLRLAPASGPYSTAFRLLVVLFAALVVVRVVHLAVL